MTSPFDALPENLPEALARAAARAPDRGIALADGRGRQVERLSWAELLDLGRRGAGRLAELGVRPGDRVLVCLPTSLGWLEAWIGAMLLGALPVAVAPPGAMGGGEGQLVRLARVAEALAATRVVTTATLIEAAEAAGERQLVACSVALEAFLAIPVGSLPPLPSPRGEDIAFLQLTSGSTGLPRAVAIRHHSAVHNAVASDEGIGAPFGALASERQRTMVSWLPLHHDMGLVGGVFFSLLAGLDLSLMPPQAFLARPRTWLDRVAMPGGTLSPAPNFAYQTCVERLADDVAVPPLGGWAAALVGAEMVRPETMALFAERFAGNGFDPRALRPCYGLAETTLAVTFDVEGAGVRTRRTPSGAELAEVVCVGRPIRDTRIRVVGADRRELPEDTLGEVEISGPGLFAGYWADPEATDAVLRDGWFASGDLGFLADGELYLTGRLKDLLILRGHNVAPHELEWVAESVVGGGGTLRAGAFSVDRGVEGEAGVVVVEVAPDESRDLARLAREVAIEVGRQVGIPLAEVVPVRRGRIPRTTSGKVQRRELRRLYVERGLERL